ncbi:MAG: chitobiase/beta-hexosaminidase C-terminal domain-containing protein, partial [Chitinophagaceae bacterium]|nr:chitobiase/beta-hexosaminidase C-terminal domain-containing protein [Chitinophagaceae bacterium]
NLETLLLNFTLITGKNLAELNKLPQLKQLSVAGTSVTTQHLAVLKDFPQLMDVYVWNIAATPIQLEELKKQKTKFRFHAGVRTDTTILKLTAPLFQNEEQVIADALPLKLKHYINGTTIRYTINGEDPDSVSSPLYDKNVKLNATTLVKTKAFKTGWISSEVVQRYFFKTGFIADSVELITQPEPKYSKGGGKLLADREKGELNAGDGKWLGYRNNRMEVLLHFNQTIDAKNVTLSSLRSLGGYIFPPESIEVWGGTDPGKLQLLGKSKPVQPSKDEPSEVVPYSVDIRPTTVRYIKIVSKPVSKLPAWHGGKGDKGWFFVDEILVN